jgi:hypothetical protein
MSSIRVDAAVDGPTPKVRLREHLREPDRKLGATGRSPDEVSPAIRGVWGR